MSPTIERVQKTHDGGLDAAVVRNGFRDRTDNDLRKTASDGIKDGGKNDADIRIRQNARQNSEECKTDCVKQPS